MSTVGPKLGLINNANIGETYYDQLRVFLQAMDQLIMGNIISSSQSVPPASPNNGDAYLLLPAPSGVWTGSQGKIAVWDTQVTNAGTNTTNPQWVYYTPNVGWIVWDVSQTSLIVYNGSNWTLIGGGTVPVTGGGTGATTVAAARANLGAAASGANSDITSLSGISDVLIGTNNVALNSPNGTVTISTTNPGGGYAVMSNGTQTISINCLGITTTGTINTNVLNATTTITTQNLAQNVAGAAINVYMLNPVGANSNSLILNASGVLYQGMLGFATYATQTTVGTAGSASALPSAPSGYLPITVNGTNYVLPFYKAS